MSKYRTEVLLNAETASTAATRVIDIDMNQKISRFSIEFKATNNGSTETAHPAAIITKVELVDGSDVLYSLNGYEAEGINVCEYGKKIHHAASYIDNNQAIFVMNMDFGRWLWDTALALDPMRFKNLQLRITHNKALGGSVPDAGTLSVFAECFDEKQINPIGFLQTKEWKSASVAASTHDYTDLPIDYPIRKMILFGRYTGVAPSSIINKVKLSENGGSKIVFNDISVSDILKYTEQNPMFMESNRISASDTARTSYCTATYETMMSWVPILGVASNWLGLASYGGTYTADVSTAEEGDLIMIGKSPHGAICLPFGDQDDLTDWYDVSKLKQLRLDITTGASSTTSIAHQIVLEQLRTY
jgi:hypothetical protein